MKKKFLIPLIFIPFLLGGCKDKHTIKKDNADLIVLDKEFTVGNILSNRDQLMKFGDDEQNKDKIISGELQGYTLLHKDATDGYYNSYNKIGVYYLELSKDGKSYNYKVSVVDVVNPIVTFKEGTSVIQVTREKPITESEIIKNYIIVTDDTSDSKNIKIVINDGQGSYSYFANATTCEVGAVFKLSIHATDEGGNEATKPFTIQVVA